VRRPRRPGSDTKRSQHDFHCQRAKDESHYTDQDGRALPLKVRACGDLKDAVLCATDPSAYMTPTQQAAFERVKAKARLTRYHGDCYIFAMLAMGFIDVIVEGAGGVITNWQGRPWRDGDALVASGDARVHAQTVALLNA